MLHTMKKVIAGRLKRNWHVATWNTPVFRECKERTDGQAALGTSGRYNDLATAFLSSQDETIKRIFSLGRLSRSYEVCAGNNW